MDGEDGKGEEEEVSIEDMPLRCLPSDANLFKDCDHMFRWFLAPYANIFVIPGASLSPAIASELMQWVAKRKAICADWLIISISDNLTPTETAFLKKLSTDFYKVEPGDSVAVVSKSISQLVSPPKAGAIPADLTRLYKKIIQCVIATFQVRSVQIMFVVLFVVI